MPETAETIRAFRREQIIRVACALVAEGGLSALTYANLESRLSFTRGVITHHFKNKRDIVQSVLRSTLAEIDAATITAVTAADDPEARIRLTLQTMVGGFLSREASTRVLLSYMSAVPHNAELTAFTAGLYARWRRWCAMVLRDGVARGVFVEHDCEAMAAVIVGQVIGAVVQQMLAPDAVDVEAVIEAGAGAILAALRIGG